ncbi:MAG: hypothetical protein N2327_04050, partial [Caldimicrobium sp.]|nr:hypothetical protein [Caldimicrobium sp.]
MNEAFVNNPLANLVSYDYGIALEFEKGPFHLRALGMQSKTDYPTDDTYNYYALQVGVRSETSLGEGNYRLYGFTTNKRFPDWHKKKKKALKGWGISIDQDLIKERLGFFLRAGFQSDKAEVDYKSMCSLGFEIKPFSLLNRRPVLGLGYSYLKAPSKNEELKHTKVLEAYLSIPIYEVEKKLATHFTLDWQFMKDRLKPSDPSDPKERSGHIFGMRVNLAF